MTNEHKSSKVLNIILWITQIVLAASLIWAASMKLFQSPEKLAAMWPWTADNLGLVKFTGVLDLLAAFGLTLPGILSIKPKMTIYTCYAIVILMICATIFHISRGEASQIGVNIFFAAMAIFIAWGRSTKAPVNSKAT